MSIENGKNGIAVSCETGIAKQLADLQNTLQASILASEERLKSVVSVHVNELTSSLEKQEARINLLIASSTANTNRSKTNESDIADLSQSLRVVEANNERLKNEIKELRDTVNVQSVRNKVTEHRLADVTDRSTRKTIVIRGVPEKDGYEKDWDVTRDIVADAVAKVTQLQKETIFKGMERVHRSGNPANPKKKGKRDVYACFYDWNIVQKILKSFRQNGQRSGVYIDQLYGPNTMYRRNLALQHRKTMVDNNEIAQGFVAYPAKLMVKYDKRDTKYTFVKDFSNVDIPVEVLSKQGVRSE